MGENNTVVSAYTTYRHLQQYCSHPSICIDCVFYMPLLFFFSPSPNSIKSDSTTSESILIEQLFQLLAQGKRLSKFLVICVILLLSTAESWPNVPELTLSCKIQTFNDPEIEGF